MHPLNTAFSNFFTVSGIIIDLRLVHPPNTRPPTLVTFVRSIEVRLLHPLNAKKGSVVSALPKVTVARLVHPLKTLQLPIPSVPNLATCVRSIEVRLEQPWKVLSGRVVIPLPRVTEARFVYPLNT